MNIKKGIYLCVSAAAGGVRARRPSGPDCPGAGKETHAATLQILGQKQHEPHPAEGPLFLYRQYVSIL